MKNHFEVCQNIDETLYKVNFEVDLFNENPHLQHQLSQVADHQLTTFYLLNTKKNQIEAKFSFFEYDGLVFSPLRASYGGFGLSTNIDIAVLQDFWEVIETHFKAKDIQAIHLTTFPACYQPVNAAILTHLFLSEGFEIQATRLNFHIYINENSFEEKLHLSEKRRLKKSEKAGFQFSEWENPNLNEVYRFIATSRSRKKFSLSLSFQAFEEILNAFPDRFKVFVVKDNQLVIALTVLVIVNSQIIYNFLPADAGEYLNFSPMVLLNKGLYDFAKNNSFQLLDLGVSVNDKGYPNYDLMRFKRNLGADLSLKLTFLKNI